MDTAGSGPKTLGNPVVLWERSSSNNIQSCFGVAAAAAFDETLSYSLSLSPLFHNHSNQDYDKEESSCRPRRRDQNGWSPHRCFSPLFGSVGYRIFKRIVHCSLFQLHALWGNIIMWQFVSKQWGSYLLCSFWKFILWGIHLLRSVEEVLEALLKTWKEPLLCPQMYWMTHFNCSSKPTRNDIFAMLS